MGKKINVPIPITEDKPKATRVRETEPGVWEYSDGSIRNEKGQAVMLPPKLREHAISSDNSHEMLRLREEKRMRLYNEGALLAVQRAGLIEAYGADAHIVERAMNMQDIASSRDAGKAAVMAAQHLDRAQGWETPKNSAPDAVAAVGDVLRMLAGFAASIPAEVVDAVVLDAD